MRPLTVAISCAAALVGAADMSGEQLQLFILTAANRRSEPSFKRTSLPKIVLQEPWTACPFDVKVRSSNSHMTFVSQSLHDWFATLLRPGSDANLYGIQIGLTGEPFPGGDDTHTAITLSRYGILENDQAVPECSATPTGPHHNQPNPRPLVKIYLGTEEMGELARVLGYNDSKHMGDRLYLNDGVKARRNLRPFTDLPRNLEPKKLHEYYRFLRPRIGRLSEDERGQLRDYIQSLIRDCPAQRGYLLAAYAFLLFFVKGKPFRPPTVGDFATIWGESQSSADYRRLLCELIRNKDFIESLDEEDMCTLAQSLSGLFERSQAPKEDRRGDDTQRSAIKDDAELAAIQKWEIIFWRLLARFLDRAQDRLQMSSISVFVDLLSRSNSPWTSLMRARILQGLLSRGLTEKWPSETEELIRQIRNKIIDRQEFHPIDTDWHDAGGFSDFFRQTYLAFTDKKDFANMMTASKYVPRDGGGTVAMRKSIHQHVDILALMATDGKTPAVGKWRLSPEEGHYFIGTLDFYLCLLRYDPNTPPTGGLAIAGERLGSIIGDPVIRAARAGAQKALIGLLSGGCHRSLSLYFAMKADRGLVEAIPRLAHTECLAVILWRAKQAERLEEALANGRATRFPSWIMSDLVTIVGMNQDIALTPERGFPPGDKETGIVLLTLKIPFDCAWVMETKAEDGDDAGQEPWTPVYSRERMRTINASSLLLIRSLALVLFNIPFDYTRTTLPNEADPLYWDDCHRFIQFWILGYHPSQNVKINLELIGTDRKFWPTTQPDISI